MKKLVKMFLAAAMMVMMVSGLAMKVSAKDLPSDCYYKDDAFKYSLTKKGCQGFDGDELKDVDHVFINVFMETAFVDDNTNQRMRNGQTYSIPEGFEKWEYEGKTYYFKDPEGLYYDTIRDLNAKNITVTAQLMLREDTSRNRLIEPSARNNSAKAEYYAPNVSDKDVIQEYKAFINFLTYRYGSIFCHIDAYVCGNEVNAPGSWNYFGTSCISGVGLNATVTNQEDLISRYVTFFNLVYDGVKKNNPGTRVCVCVDHSFNESAGNTRIPVKTFLNSFNKKVGDREWCLAYHCYPVGMFNPSIGAYAENPKNENAKIVDGYNLEVLTQYVKNNFGSNHRILLTEQGFSKNTSAGESAQAAGLVYTYYKAKFDDMIDAMHVLKFEKTDEHGGSGFELGTTSKIIWSKLDNGSDADETYILNQIKTTQGIGDFRAITSNWKPESQMKVERDKKYNQYKYYFSGIDLSPVFDLKYYETSHPIIKTYIANDSRYERNAFAYFVFYDMFAVNSNKYNGISGFNAAEYVNAHIKDAPSGLTQAQKNAYVYIDYARKKTAPPADKDKVKQFVSRLYTDCLGRGADAGGLNYWTEKLVNREVDGATAAAGFIFSDEYQSKKSSQTEYIVMLYKVFMNRDVSYDIDGFKYWRNQMNNSLTREAVFKQFVESAEFTKICKDYGIDRGKYTLKGLKDNVSYTPNEVLVKQFVTRMYTECLGREAEPDGLNYWTKMLMAGTTDGSSVVAEFVFGNEYQSKGVTKTQYINMLYKVFLGRDAEGDQGGLAYWKNELKNGKTREMVFKGFLDSQEFSNLCKSYGIEKGVYAVKGLKDPAVTVNQQTKDFVERLYSIALGRNSDLDGLNYWARAIAEEEKTPSEVAEQFLTSNEFVNRNLNNADFISVLYMTFLGREPEPAGFNDWLNKLNTGTARVDVIRQFVDSNEFKNIVKSFGL